MAFQIPLFSDPIIIQKPIFTIIFLSTLLPLFFYLLGSFTAITNPPITTAITATTHSNITTSPCLNFSEKTEHPFPSSFALTHQLDFAAHHFQHEDGTSSSPIEDDPFVTCPTNFTNYCPCQDSTRLKRFSAEKFLYKERHCPEDGEKVRCLVPRPRRYRRPFMWPKSRDMAWYVNVPFKRLTVDKKQQNWVRLEGDRLVFPGGGTSFPHGVKGYVDLLKQVVPLKSGSIRTALDIGCGVATFGGALLEYNILTMSVAPVDVHEAQVQFALERGLPAMLGVLSTYRLPYPSRSFDLAHCSRCLVKWANYDGLYLMEIDRVLRPGGYWVLSGPPIGWRISYKGWQRTVEDLQNEQIGLEDLARKLCWKKIAEKGPIAVWQKPTNHIHCAKRLKAWKSPQFCRGNDPDSAWYTELQACITPLPNVKKVKDTSGGLVRKWPQRLNVAPPRISRARNEAITTKTFDEDNRLWKRRVQLYGRVLGSLSKGGYRNVMDMNAGLGGFAAALSTYPLWVMNVVPFDSDNNTLGVIYERGLIGSYMNWCEAFSTYPRTYDLIHADGIFSMYMKKCDVVDILLEMYRILRPHGAVIIRDHVDVIVKVKDLMKKMGWNNTTLSHTELGPLHPSKLLFVDNSNTT